jgi:hypothetical protein
MKEMSIAASAKILVEFMEKEITPVGLISARSGGLQTAVSAKGAASTQPGATAQEIGIASRRD